MRIVPIHLYLLPFVLSLATLSPAAQALAENPPDFDEIRNLVRSNLAGVTEAELNHAALDGLLRDLRGKVRLLGGSDAASATSNAPAIGKTTVFDNAIALLRIRQVAASLPIELSRTCSSLAATNKLSGLILDLRFAGGEDYAAAANTADLFVATAQPLLDWGNGPVKSLEKSDSLRWPVVVLVNGETTGAAEALAAVLREVGAALILGGTTRGAAMTTHDFPLSNGQLLRIATSPVKLGAGIPISTKGVKPDIQVTVTPEAERAFQEDPYAASAKSNVVAAASSPGTVTNRPARRTRPNEADLVRARRDGFSLDGEFPLGRDTEAEKPVIRDPALSRAVDLLKGLAVVRRARP